MKKQAGGQLCYERMVDGGRNTEEMKTNTWMSLVIFRMEIFHSLRCRTIVEIERDNKPNRVIHELMFATFKVFPVYFNKVKQDASTWCIIYELFVKEQLSGLSPRLQILLMTAEVLDWYGIKHPNKGEHLTWHYQDEVCTKADTGAELWMDIWINSSPIGSQGLSAWYSKYQIIRGVMEESGREGQVLYLSAKTFWFFSSFKRFWFLSKQLESKLFRCHSWKK